MKTLGWNFVSTGGSKVEGIHQGSIEQFVGDYNYYLAREIIQNSLDAKKENEVNPVRVSFDLEFYDKKSFPGYKDILQVFKFCLNFWPSHKEEHVFAKNAIKCLESDNIPILKISDFNTKGLTGTDTDIDGSWFGLVKSSGTTTKTGGEGGSFGIGKGAPFAATDLRIIFYSTLNEKSQSIFQGIAEIVSFRDSEGDIKRGTGSFGFGQESVRDLNTLATIEKFWRKENIGSGTDIYIAGYKVGKNWESDLIKSVLRNFWYAIFRNDLVVNVSGTEISASTLESHLIDYFMNEPFRDDFEPVGNPLQYYKAVKEGRKFSKDLRILKDSLFFYYQVPERMNYVAMIRKSHMVIYSKPKTFPENFAGVFICDNEDGNLELRSMEPPAHDKWDPSRHENGKKILDEINIFIRESLESIREIKEGSILELPDLHKFLPFDEEADEPGTYNSGSEYTGEEGSEETARQKPIKFVFEKRAVINPYKVSVLNQPNADDTEKEPIKRVREHKGGGGKRKPKKKDKLFSRSYLSNQKENSYIYTVILRSEKILKTHLKVIAVGEDEMESGISIVNVNHSGKKKYHFTGNKIHNVDITPTDDTIIQIEFNSPTKYALKFETYVIQQKKLSSSGSGSFRRCKRHLRC